MTCGNGSSMTRDTGGRVEVADRRHYRGAAGTGSRNLSRIHDPRFSSAPSMA